MIHDETPKHRPPARGEKLLGLSRSALYKAVANGLLEPPHHLGARAVAWSDAQLERFRRKLANVPRQRPEAAIAAVRAKAAAKRVASAEPPNAAA